MERINGIVMQNKDKIKYLVLGCAALAGFNCLTRPDFNLILYLFIYNLWYVNDDGKDKVRKKINKIRKLKLKRKITRSSFYFSAL
jgi:hypothetical protein